MRHNHKVAKQIAGWVIGVLVLTYAFSRGWLSARPLIHFLKTPSHYLIPLFFCACILLLNSLRWRYILNGLGVPVTFRQVVWTKMVSAAVGLLVPTGMGQDVSRTIFLGRGTQEMKRVALSVLFDRAVGLLGLLFVGVLGGGYLYATGTPEAREVLEGQLLITILLATGGTVALVTIRRRVRRLVHPRRIAIIGLSILSGVVTIGMHWYLGQELGNGMSFALNAFAVPMVMVASMFSLLPLGIGIGQVSFFHIVKTLSASHAVTGAMQASLFQFFSFVFDAAGGILLLRGKKMTARSPRKEIRRAS